MSSLQQVLRRYGEEYLQRFGANVPRAHREVLRILPMCRTTQLGTCWYYCPSCRTMHARSRSCGNRHCATCQQARSQKWLQRQVSRLLPCEYFLVTFTLPQELRAVARANQRVVYQALMQASAESLKDLAADPRLLGSRQLGFFGVLQTWGRTLEYHPHVHYIVAGGAVSPCGTHWKACRPGFFLPGKPLGRLFRGKFLAALQAAGLTKQIAPAVRRKNWVVDIQPSGNGEGALKYLASYIFRVAISDGRIQSCNDHQVRFRYTPSGKRRSRSMVLNALEFVRRFLQHVLPKGFHKVRYHGFLHPNSKHSIQAIRLMIRQSRGESYYLECDSHEQDAILGISCPDCGTRLVWISFEPPRKRVTWATILAARTRGPPDAR